MLLARGALVSVLLARGDLAAARGVVSDLGPPAHPIAHHLALRVRLADDPAAAAPVADAILEGAWPPGRPLSPFAVQFTRAAATLAHALYACGDLERLRRLVGMMSQHDPLTNTCVGLVALAEGRHDVAETLLRSSAAVFEQAPEPVEHARVLIDLATAQAAAGRRRRATASLLRAQRIAGDITAWALVEEVQKVARALDIRIAVASAGQSRGLSAREKHVTALVAAGLSNAEIAHHVHLSVGTVGRLVSAILVKLDLRTRAELTAWFVANEGPAARPTTDRDTAAPAPR